MGFEPHQPPSKVEVVNEFTDRMKSALEEAKSALSKAKDDMARYYNWRRIPAPTFAPEMMFTLMPATSRPPGPRKSYPTAA